MAALIASAERPKSQHFKWAGFLKIVSKICIPISTPQYCSLINLLMCLYLQICLLDFLHCHVRVKKKTKKKQLGSHDSQEKKNIMIVMIENPSGCKETVAVNSRNLDVSLCSCCCYYNLQSVRMREKPVARVRSAWRGTVKNCKITHTHTHLHFHRLVWKAQHN